MRRVFYIIFCLLLISRFCFAEGILLEAEGFLHKGGWVVDSQSIPSMGSSYLLAHGIGVPVENASTSFIVNKSGDYKIWVRTRDWTKHWSDNSAGKFQVIVNGKVLPTTFGVKNEQWSWESGGVIHLEKGENTIELHDLTGFDGRCDAIYLTTNEMILPNAKDLLINFRKKALGITFPKLGGEYDLVVVGGGIAGCCVAISAARLGCKVALIQNRPVLGGNNSSEVRVGLSGLIMQQPYPNIGNLMDELGGVGYWTYYEAKQDTTLERSKEILAIINKHPEKLIHNAGPASNYEDNKKLKLINSEPNISLFLSTQVIKVNKVSNEIVSVIGKNIESSEEYLFRGKLFCDCTGDGELGFLAGADYMMGRESKKETNEPNAPERPDQLVMGTSVQWYSEKTEQNMVFPDCPWAIQFTDSTCFAITRGDWDWETGLDKDQIDDIEFIRDHALRAVYGNWAFLKNHSKNKVDFAKRKLVWVAYIGGKRESRRLVGDVLLKEQDIMNRTPYKDASFTTTWGIDLHYPKVIEGLNDAPFIAYSDTKKIVPYAVPYRCLYSKNIDNLFMAGRNISVTHIVLGTIRVMRTGGMMGEVVGMAASICKKYNTLPRSVYNSYLSELQILMKKGVGKRGFTDR